MSATKAEVALALSAKPSYLSFKVSVSFKHVDARSVFFFYILIVKSEYFITVRLPIPGLLLFLGPSEGLHSPAGLD